jgi:hypothetical protein
MACMPPPLATLRAPAAEIRTELSVHRRRRWSKSNAVGYIWSPGAKELFRDKFHFDIRYLQLQHLQPELPFFNSNMD